VNVGEFQQPAQTIIAAGCVAPVRAIPHPEPPIPVQLRSSSIASNRPTELDSADRVPRVERVVYWAAHNAVMVHGLRTISLYSGAGGLDHGFIRAGFDVVWANEIDPTACETYRANIGDHIVCRDVLETAPPPGPAEVVIGGPPCQGFSVIGKMDRDDPLSRHVFQFLNTVEAVGAEAFVLENVKALGANPRWASVREALVQRAQDMGFEVELFLLNAAHYRVPQARERMFLVGVRGAAPLRPRAVTVTRPLTVREAISKLPNFGDPGNDGIIGARVVPAAKPVMRPTPFKGSLLFNGSGRPLHLDSPSKTLPASMGGNATPIIDQDELDHGAEPWVVSYHQRLMAGKPPLKRAPARLRRLTVQEAAALQSFPVDWTFAGARGAQLRQLGNAVPPNFAFSVARAVRSTLEARHRTAATASRAGLPVAA
jgi:DNA (cytosine-5)-methyltransferase 1